MNSFSVVHYLVVCMHVQMSWTWKCFIINTARLVCDYNSLAWGVQQLECIAYTLRIRCQVEKHVKLTSIPGIANLQHETVSFMMLLPALPLGDDQKGWERVVGGFIKG